MSRRPRVIVDQKTKDRIIKEVSSGKITYKEAQIKYGINGHSTVLRWVKKAANSNDIGKKITKQTAIYEKEISLRLIGTSKEELQEVAHAIHSLGHPLTIGGKGRRKVTVTHTSTDPRKVFDGVI